jgi:CelD/BcsL family acetyltransferase involved in cellulose biosynthesis
MRGIMPDGIEWIGDEAGLNALAEPWETLADRERLPFLRHRWFSEWWAAFGAGWQLQICALWERNELAALFPLCGRRGRLDALANVHSPIFHPFGRDERAVAAVVDAAVRASADEILLEALPENGSVTARVVSAARAAGRITRLEPQHVSPIVDVDGTFEAYRERLASRARGDLARRRRKMEREHETAFALVEAPVDLEPALDGGFAVEASGWKGAAGTAIVSRPDTEGFYRGIARAFHAADKLRLCTLRLDGRLAAFDLCLLDGNRLWLLKDGYDESFARLAPGLVLRLAVIERCFELGVEGLELLGDDEPWKRTFATSTRRHVGLRCYRRRPVPLARFAYRRAIRPALRSAYRRVRPVRRGRG